MPSVIGMRFVPFAFLVESLSLQAKKGPSQIAKEYATLYWSAVPTTTRRHPNIWATIHPDHVQTYRKQRAQEERINAEG